MGTCHMYYVHTKFSFPTINLLWKTCLLFFVMVYVHVLLLPSPFIAIMCALFFIISFPFALGNGLYLFQLFDQFAGTLPLLLIGFCEVATISYVYGVHRSVHPPTHCAPSVIYILFMYFPPLDFSIWFNIGFHQH